MLLISLLKVQLKGSIKRTGRRGNNARPGIAGSASGKIEVIEQIVDTRLKRDVLVCPGE